MKKIPFLILFVLIFSPAEAQPAFRQMLSAHTWEPAPSLPAAKSAFDDSGFWLNRSGFPEWLGRGKTAVDFKFTDSKTGRFYAFVDAQDRRYVMDFKSEFEFISDSTFALVLGGIPEVCRIRKLTADTLLYFCEADGLDYLWVTHTEKVVNSDLNAEFNRRLSSEKFDRENCPVVGIAWRPGKGFSEPVLQSRSGTAADLLFLRTASGLQIARNESVSEFIKAKAGLPFVFILYFVLEE